MNRRNLLWSTLASAGAGLIAARAAAAPTDATPTKLRVVYHLADVERVNFALGNIQNHFDGAGGPDHVAISLVVLGPALRAFTVGHGNPDVAGRIGRLGQSGLTLAACHNTMTAHNLTLDQLLPGFSIAARGGVVMIAELQAQGYAYIRP